jgi:DNA invertase Pin-like site-specific DNA recombinase
MKDYLNNNQDCKTVFIWEISRLARTEKVLHSIKEWLVSRGVQLHIFDKRISLLQRDGSEDPNTGLIFSILGSFASQEAKQIKARFNRGKAANKELGRYNGGKMKYGYKTDGNGYFIPNESEAEIVKLTFEMYATGKYSHTSLTKELMERGYQLHLRKVTKILQDKCYYGGTEIKYPPLVSKELFDKCREVAGDNYTERSRTDNVAFARKLLKCPCCGYNYSVKLNKMGWVYYCVANAQDIRNRLESMNVARCDNKIHLSRNLLDAVIWYVVKPIHYNFLNNLTKTDAERIRQEIELLEEKERVVEKNIAKLQISKMRINEMYEKQRYTEDEYEVRFEQNKKQVDEQKANLLRFNEEKTKLFRLLRKLENHSTEELDEVKSDLTLEQMDVIVKQHIKSIDLDRTDDNMNTIVTISPMIGEPYVFYLKKSAKQNKVWVRRDDELVCIDDELMSATASYWKKRNGGN